ncbi:MAG TPA: VanW family protein [Candidatus Dormibacteraeota bacterium]|nr:VanW family protein [Candidatus Dormibacteraeota bacterium]
MSLDRITNRLILNLGLAAAGLFIIAQVGLVWAGAGKIYPGVTVNGVYVGNLSRDQAKKKIGEEARQYMGKIIPVQYGDTTLSIPVSGIGVAYSTAAVDEAYNYGRSGNFIERLQQRWRLLTSRQARFDRFNIDDAKLRPFLQQAEEAAVAPVSNAMLNFHNGSVGVGPAIPGKRLERGGLILTLQKRIASMNTELIRAPIYNIEPKINETDLAAAKAQADTFISSPLTVTASGRTEVIELPTIVSWIEVSQSQSGSPLQRRLTSYYEELLPVNVKLAISKKAVEGYVAELAGKVNQEGQDAALTIDEGRATVFRPSRNGIALEQPQAVEAIIKTLGERQPERKVALATKIIKPAINEENLNNLGIKELLSEGVSFFPGSNPERIQNIRVGKSKYNGVLLKPGEVFSFGKLLGDVGPETGYAPSKVIIGNRQELQYGGGLCQVSSTAYRAALNAGLPILERVNHSFAVSFYTQPYGVPGVDATIYYPAVDFKFKNDTPAHILIQTVMQGTTLKFQFYGTKTKEGRIRGPEFVSGSTNAEEPSHTVFYRDVLDLNGQVIKTDTVHTYYKSSKDFPSKPQFN